MTIKQKFSSIDQSKLTADQKSFLDKIKNVTKNFSDAEMNKKVEQPLDNFIAKAKEKMPEAVKSAPVKSTSKAKSSQTRKPKRTAMSLAKEIRKEGESWNDARARASKMMKEDSKDLSKTVETELDKLSKLVKSAKTRSKLAGISGTDIKRDAVRKAKPRGARRVTHSGETSNQYGTFSNKLGRKYYESRDRHSDRLAPNYPKNAPFLADGGYLTDPTFGNFQNQVLAEGGNIDAFTLRMVKSNGMQPAEVLKEDANVRYNRGGSVTNERKHVNKVEDYEVRYAKPRPQRKGYKGMRKFAEGGSINIKVNGLYKKSKFINDDYNWKSKLLEMLQDNSIEAYNIYQSLNKVEKEEVLQELYEMDNDMGSYGDEDMETSKENLSILLDDAKNGKKYASGGGVGGLNAGMPLDGFSNTSYTGLVGETSAMSSGEMFMNGGGLPSGVSQPYMITEALGNPAQHLAKGGGVRKVGNREYSYGRNWTNDQRHVNKSEEHEVKYNRKGKFLGVFAGGGKLNNAKIKDWYIKNYPTDDLGEKLNDNVTFEDMWNEDYKKYSVYDVMGVGDSLIRERLFEHLAKLKGVSYNEVYDKLFMSTDYNKGGAITNERKHVNKGEDYEVRYAKPRPSRKGYKGTRKFMAGGMNNETPRIYVADLEAYNNGRLVGEWLDLSDYNDADELMDAIQDVLKKSGGEEYAIHDVEYVPRNMYSEYMGQRDFEELYKMMDLAKQNDLPLEVVQDIVSQYSENAIDDFVGKYDSAEDFAYQQVEEIGLENFSSPEYYVYITNTNRRLLAGEMADSYVQDIRDEDGGNRLIEEAGLNLDEYENADEQEKEELLDLASSMVNDEYYDNWYEGLNDPYYFLVEEQGMYSAEDFFNASFISVDYEKLGRDLDQDYTIIEYDGDVYVFNIR